MQDNYLKRSLYLLTLILFILLLLSALPEFQIGANKFKKIDLLADIESDPVPLVTAVKKDSVVAKKKKTKTKPKPKISPCGTGVPCIEDYSDDHNALAKFLKALKQTHSRPVKIAFLGDSFIEGDILSASLRDTLQQLYGGHGVGFVPIASEVSQYRTTIQHSFSGWKTYSVVGSKSPHSPPGMSGYCFVPHSENQVEYKPAKRRGNKFNKVSLFYVSPLPSVMHYTVNDSLSFDQPLSSSDSLRRTVLSLSGAQSVKLHFEPVDSLKLYGASFEDATGIYVDNFAMRGNSGMGLFQVSSRQMKEFDQFQHYKLILLQYGLNVVGETDSAGYEWYAEKMVKVVNQLKENFPQSSILLMSISDRSYNHNGKFVTMPNIMLMREAQREVARRSKIAFWDLWEAMGGENSMVKFVSANPPQAAKDYTHLTYWGGKKLAKKLADAVLYERIKK